MKLQKNSEYPGLNSSQEELNFDMDDREKKKLYPAIS